MKILKKWGVGLAEQFRIRLAVSPTDLAESINSAIKQINRGNGLDKIKIGVDTSALDEAVKRIKSEIADITGKVGTSKIDLGISSGGGKALNAVTQSHNKELDNFVTGYMQKFDIVKKSAVNTVEEIREKFAVALSDVFSAKTVGNENGIASAFENLIRLTKEFSKTSKNDAAIDALEQYKASLNGIVPISEDVRAELKYVYGSAADVKKALNEAFGSKGWKFTDTSVGDMGSDQFLANLGLPGYSEIENVSNGIIRLMETMRQLRADAKQKVSLFDIGARSSEDVVNFIKTLTELNNARVKQGETAKTTAQSEKQAAGSLQSAAEVAEKFKTVLTPILGEGTNDYISQMMSSIEPYKNVVDALGQALDRLSSAKSLNMADEMSALNDSFSTFREGLGSPEGLINELNTFAAAKQKNVAVINSEKTALNELSAEIDNVKKKKNQLNSESGKQGNSKNIGFGIDVNTIIKSINSAVRDINKNSPGSLSKVKISVDPTRLRSSIRQAVTEINKGTGLDTSPVKLSIAFKNVKQAVSELQKQLNVSSVKIGGISAGSVSAKSGETVGNAVKRSAEQAIAALERQTQAERDVANAARDSSATVVNADNSEKRSANLLSAALDELVEKRKELGRLINEQQNFMADGTPISKTVKTGTVTRNTTDRYRYDTESGNYKLTGIAENFNASAIKSNLDKLYVAAVQLETKLKDVNAAYTDINSAKPIKEQSHLDDLKSKYDNIVNSIIEMTKTSGENTAVLKANIDAEIADLERLSESYRNAEYAATSLRTKDITTVKVEENNNINAFVSNIVKSKVPLSEMRTDIDKLRESLNNVTDKNSLIDYLNQFSVATSKFKALSTEVDAANKMTRELKNSMSSLNKISNNTTFYKNNGVEEIKVLLSGVEQLKTSYRTLMDSLKSDSSSENLAKIREQMTGLQEKTAEMAAESDRLIRSLKQVRIDDNSLKKANQLIAQMEEYMRKNAAAMGKPSSSGATYGSEIQAFISQLQTAGNIGDAELQKIANGFANIKYQIKAANLEGNTFLGELKEKATKFIKWTAMTLVITKARMYFRQLFTTVYELDTELVDLKKTFNGTAEELNDFYFEANKLAKQMGITTAEAIKLGSAWSRLGYSSNETMKKMAEMSAMFAAISPDMNSEQAQNGLVSIMKAFDIDPENVLDGILSKVNIIGNTAATSNGAIVEMLEKSSSAMKEANNTLEQTIALETAAVEITQDASSVGNAFKTVSMRIRGYDEETEEYIGNVEELSGKIADLTKTASKPGGISLFTDANKTTYKSTYQLLKDISEIYNELSDKQQAGLLEALAGKRQGQIVAATIKNFGAAEKALDNMANSAGSAEAELVTYQESAEYLFNQFKETFTSIAQNSVKRDDLKNLIKFGTSMLGIVDKTVEKLGLIPTILSTAVGIVASKKFAKGGIFGLNDEGKLTALGSQLGKGWWGNVTGKTQRDEIQKNIKAVNEFHTALKTGQMSQEKYNAVMKNSNAEIKRYGRAALKAGDDTSVYRKTTKNLNSELKNVGKNGKLAGVGAKAAAIGVQALNTAASMLISLGISLAINALFSAISNAVNSVENNISKLKELKSEIEGLKSDVVSINDKLSETKLKISALEKMPKLTFLEKEELEELKRYNDELERQRRIVENQTKADNAKANSTAQATWHDMNTASSADATKWWNYLGILMPGVGNLISGITDISKNVQNNFFGDQKKQLDDYEKILKKIKQIEGSEEYKKDSSKFEKTIKDKKNELAELESKIASSYGKWNEVLAGLDPTLEVNKEAINSLQLVIDKWDILSGKIETTFKGIYNAPQFSSVKQYLDDLAQKGELTAEKFDNLTESEVSGIDRFREALENVENLTTDDVIESIIKDVQDLNKETENGEDAVRDYTEALKKLYETLDDIIDKQEKLADAFKKIQRGAALSAQEIYELIKEMPDLAQYIERTTDGYSISDKGISAVAEKNQRQARENAEKDLENIRENIALLEKRDELEKKRDELEKEMISSNGSLDTFRRWDNADVEYHKAVEACQGISDTLEELKSVEQAVLVAQGVLDEVFNGFAAVENYEDAKSEISEYNKDIQTLDKAIRSLNEGTSLSYDEMVEIVDIAPDLQVFFEEMEDGYTISADKIEWWSRKTKTARDAYIQSLIEQAEAEKKTAEAERDAAKAALDAADAANKAAAAIQYSIAQQNVDNIDEVIKKYKALMSELKSPDDKNSISDALQNEIDYYKNILEAVQIVHDKYNDSLEREKEYLEDVKDSLKEANDERQREIELREAAINLENAKKRKVYVYSEGEGFKQVSDEGAIKEAEEKYRDAIADAQEAELDKQIDAIEKAQETLDKRVEYLTSLEQDIENANTVEQAKSALGLADEKDLLNLPEAVKDGIKNGLAEVIVEKSNQENEDKTDRDGNSLYTPATLDDVLKSIGATVTADDIKSMASELPAQAAYNAAVKGFADSLNEFRESLVNSASVVNNGGVVINNSFTINDASDAEKVGEVVEDHISDLLTRYCNSIK